MAAPPEELAYVAQLSTDGRPDALAVVDLDPASSAYGTVVGLLEMPVAGDELHHFGWNACSTHLCPYAPHPHTPRRYLIVPGLRSSRIYIVDVGEDPRSPRIVKTIEPDQVYARTGYSRPHTVHCGPDNIYVSADIMLTSEWGTPSMIEGGLDPELLMGREYGHRLHVWDLRRRRHLQAIDLGDEHHFALELRPAHDPAKTHGFLNTTVSVEDLSSSVWTWHRPDGAWAVARTVAVPAEPADADRLPPALQPFGAVPPLITDHVLSLDDRRLFVSYWAPAS